MPKLINRVNGSVKLVIEDLKELFCWIKDSFVVQGVQIRQVIDYIYKKFTAKVIRENRLQIVSLLSVSRWRAYQLSKNLKAARKIYPLKEYLK